MSKSTSRKWDLSLKQRDELLAALKARFDANLGRHPGLVWTKVQARLEARPHNLWSLHEMERTVGEGGFVERWTKELDLLNLWQECNP